MLCYLVDPIFQVINTAGKPATGGYIEVYDHVTGDKYYCASDFDGTLHPFKIPLDSLGSNIILADDASTYDIYAYNRYGSLLMSRHNVSVSNSGGGSGEASRKGTIHKIGLWAVDAADPPPKPNEYWVIDLESPNEEEPSGYDRLTVERAREIHNSGAFFGLRTEHVQNPYEDNLLLETYYDYVSMAQTFVVRLSNISGYNEFVEYELGGFGDYVGVNKYTTSTLLAEDGNGSDVTVTFTEADTRTNITSDSKLSVLFGKIMKWFSDLKALAFKDKAYLTQDVSGVLPIANGGTNASTEAGARTNLDVYSKSEVDNAIRKGKLHRISVRHVQAADPSPKPSTDWIIDLESPNANESDGYDRLTVTKAIEIHEAGEMFVFASSHVSSGYNYDDSYYEAIFNSNPGSVRIILVKSGYHQSPNEISLATIDNYGDYLGISDAFQDSEYWNVTLVREGSDELRQNKIHRYSFGDGTVDGETPVYGSWLIDLDKPDPNGPEGYSRVTPAEFWRTTAVNGEVPVYLQDKNDNNSLTYAYLSRTDVTKSGSTVTSVFAYFVRSGYGNDLSQSNGFRYTKLAGSDYLQKAAALDDWFEAIDETDADARYLKLSGGTMTGPITLASDGLHTNSNAGFKLDAYGTFKHLRNNATDSIGVNNYAGNYVFGINYESGAVKIGKWEATPVEVSYGGTGANTAADARTNLDVYSKAEVNNAIDTAVASAYHAAGTKTVAQLTNSLLVAANQGNVYNITDSGTTTADFVDGAGHPINAGDNVGICDVGGGVYKFDLLSGFVDMSNCLQKNGDGKDVTVTFTEAATRTDIASTESLSTLFGKIKKWLADLAAVAFSGSYGDLTNKPSIANVDQYVSDTDTISFDFVNDHIYHLTATIQGTLKISSSYSGFGIVWLYIGLNNHNYHYKIQCGVNIQNGTLVTNDIKLPIDWKATGITGSSDNRLHIEVLFNTNIYSFASSSAYNLFLTGTDCSGV